KERERRAIGRDRGGRVEIPTADDRAGLGRAVRGDRHELVHDVGHRRAEVMSLADADPPSAVERDHPVGEALLRLRVRRDRLRLTARRLPIDTLVNLVDEIYRSLM